MTECANGHLYRETVIDGPIACKDCGHLLKNCVDGCGLLRWSTDRLKSELQEQQSLPMSTHDWMVVLVAGLRGVIPHLYDSMVLGIRQPQE